MAGVPGGKVIVVPYDDGWPAKYEREAEAVRNVIGGLAGDVQHIGSTAIPGMCAKPIIDMAVSVADIALVDRMIKPLEGLGYEYRGVMFGDAGHHFFRKGAPREFFLHVHRKDSGLWRERILFRDFLRTHGKVAEEYELLKRDLANRFPDDRTSYTAGKRELISKIIERAKQEGALPANSTEAIRDAWDSLAESYVKMLSDTSQRGLAASVELAAFEREISPRPCLSILDAGCGPGFHGRHLIARGHRVTFVDVSPVMLEHARNSLGQDDASRAQFLERDIRDMPDVPDSAFDAIISGGTVVSDCGDPRRALAELSRVLRPSGVMGFSVRNLDGPQQERYGRTEVVKRGGPGFDWWFFSIESVGKLCAEAGLSCERICPVLLELPDSPEPGDAVKHHLDAGEHKRWRSNAWELFTVARKRTRQS